ncbi:DapH/DapD/GlmU-related protein [Jeotgalibacillus sp. ET6]|nr:DapH/DapD/GlmU-related protein [Jeotgalibacillus sp. ET6]MDG5471370.1 DapH/DapD/GlmU-related protein [Jeotgalibacillus sp. ET6]
MKTKEILGKVLYKLIAKKLPYSHSKINFGSKYIRALCGKVMLKHCGDNINIEKGASFGRNISLGNNSGIGIDAELSSDIYIGSNVMMGPECRIYTQNHSFQNKNIPMYMQGFSTVKPVHIDDDVWIGSRVIILPGVKVGKGSIIGAGSVVTKDVPEYSVVAGNPAKVVKYRT